MRRNFFEHPSISAVIARHLASHHTRPDGALEARVKAIENNVTTLQASMDSIVSRLAVLETKNGIPPPQKIPGGGERKGGKVRATMETRP